MVMFQELLFHCYIVVGDAEDYHAVARLLGVAHFVDLLLLGGKGVVQPSEELVLDEEQGFHGMLEGQLVLAHLGKNGADVDVDVARIGNDQAIVNGLLRKVQEIVLYLQSLLQVVECASEFVCSSENAGVVVVCDSSVPVSFLRQRFRLPQQLQRHIEVPFLQDVHSQDVADDSSVIARLNHGVGLLPVDVLLKQNNSSYFFNASKYFFLFF
eukprot:CAMPEP_0202964618 /NCGR_PEP_ID=MMETSP1396-20130829/8699_1 /ASSEMBLY_ACC=CAM_ASM_000872 /TAXON_ID= /ORGANISM="Pseudokeronopsis sp., Strain Brazil" /LENGTH=211 /DNA_ID=CAMNT_0049686851 /DNA_START=209 /DNA_END=845 /DNA_ORIENTATION=+